MATRNPSSCRRWSSRRPAWSSSCARKEAGRPAAVVELLREEPGGRRRGARRGGARRRRWCGVVVQRVVCERGEFCELTTLARGRPHMSATARKFCGAPLARCTTECWSTILWRTVGGVHHRKVEFCGAPRCAIEMLVYFFKPIVQINKSNN